MRSTGLWHPRLAELVAALGHAETVVLADAGLPVPPGVEPIDLVWARREPRLLPLLRVVLDELVVESVTVAAEMPSGPWSEELLDVLNGRSMKHVPHDELKAACQQARAIVRTGEDTPFTNVILHAGVAF
ncbi:MAG: D-ribose pyranase [Jatrophihabitans sp.]